MTCMDLEKVSHFAPTINGNVAHNKSNVVHSFSVKTP